MKRKIRCAAACLLLLGFTVCPCFAQGVHEKYLALTFDDGPSGQFTRRLLEGLESRQAQVTFFLCGYRMEQYPDLAGEMVAAGHEIGLHGYSHSCMSCMEEEMLEQELSRTEDPLWEQTGVQSSLLRPPGGKAGRTVVQAAEEHGLSLITWSVDPKDWSTHEQARIVSRVVEQAKDGDIILLHDMSNSSVHAALEIIDRLEQEGYQFVTVSELARLRGRAMEAGSLYTNFRPAFEVDVG